MIFSSLFFIFIFLPLVLVAYYLVPRKFKNLCLVLFSLVFYAWGEPIYVLLMIFTILVDYACGLCVARFIDRRGKAKLFITINIVINLALLGFFKYAGMLVGTFDAVTGLGLSIPEVALPIGISFYTFESMSYAIDVYRREAPAMRNIIDFAAYLSFFPHLVAGPIVRYEALQAQVLNRRETLEKFTEGTKRFLTGLFKKVLIADNLAILAERVQYLGTPSTLTAWMGILAFTFQIYFDFSGYSDMAIGLGKMFGFELPENFDHPYVSQSVSEFWRRWHMTLGGWFREYVYIPLGGNRKGRLCTVRNLAIVWVLTGMWHGASWNFAFWGALLRRAHHFGKALSAKKSARQNPRLLPLAVQLFGGGHRLAVFFLHRYWTGLLRACLHVRLCPRGRNQPGALRPADLRAADAHRGAVQRAAGAQPV